MNPSCIDPALVTSTSQGSGEAIILRDQRSIVPLFLTLVCIKSCEVLIPGGLEGSRIRCLCGVPFTQEFERLCGLMGIALKFRSIIANLKENAMFFQSKFEIDPTRCELSIYYYKLILTNLTIFR